MSTDTALRSPALVVGGKPVLGHAWQLLRDPLGFLESLRDHGEVVRIRLGPKTAYAVCAPELVGELLLDKARLFIVGGPLWDTLESLLGKGVATSNGAVHLRQRRMIQPTLRPEQIAHYAAVMEDEARATAERWRPGQIIDVTGEMFDTAVRIVSRSLLKVDSIGRKTDEISASLHTVFAGMYQRMALSMGSLSRLPTPANRRFDRALAALHGVVREIIEERRLSGVREEDLLAALLDAKEDGTGEPLSDQEIHDHVVSMVVAGAENVASTLAWTFHLLSQHPGEETRLHRELDSVADNNPIGVKNLSCLPHTRNVITESMRLLPAVWIFTRRCTADTELGGYLIPEGADIVYSPYALQRDGRSFDRPLAFDPDRWTRQRAAEVTPFAMMPFGVGNRKCPGDHFAMTEIALILNAVASRWRLVPLATTDATTRIGITLQPKRLHMRAEPR